jgi:hypothetical protein
MWNGMNVQYPSISVPNEIKLRQMWTQKKRVLRSDSLFVPRVGLEPTRPKRTHGPQPCLSTNFSTWAVQGCFASVTRLGLEPRTLSLKVRCSNQLSYQVVPPSLRGGKDRQIF